MADIAFPSSPTTGQQYTFNGRTWEWTGYAWKLATVTPTQQGQPLFVRIGVTALARPETRYKALAHT